MEVKAAADRTPGLSACEGPPTYLSRISPGGGGSGGYGSPFPPEGARCALKMPNQRGNAPSSRTRRNPVVVEAAMTLDVGEREPACAEPCLCCLHRADLHLPDFLENHCLDEEVKLFKRMGSPLTNCTGWQAPGRAGQVCLGKAHRQSRRRASGAGWPLRDPLHPRVSGLLPEPLCTVTRQPFDHRGALYQAVDQMETVKLFAGKKKLGCKSIHTVHTRVSQGPTYLFLCLI